MPVARDPRNPINLPEPRLPQENPVNNPPMTPGGAPVAQEFPCGNCGAKLHYDAGAQAMKDGHDRTRSAYSAWSLM